MSTRAVVSGDKQRAVSWIDALGDLNGSTAAVQHIAAKLTQATPETSQAPAFAQKHWSALSRLKLAMHVTLQMHWCSCMHVCLCPIWNSILEVLSI